MVVLVGLEGWEGSAEMGLEGREDMDGGMDMVGRGLEAGRPVRGGGAAAGPMPGPMVPSCLDGECKD